MSLSDSDLPTKQPAADNPDNYYLPPTPKGRPYKREPLPDIPARSHRNTNPLQP